MYDVSFSSPEQESLYSKALFRTIGVDELQISLSEVDLYSPSDSYLLKTLKLRLHILRLNDGPEVEIRNLEEEILKNVKARCKYICCISGCSFRTANHERYQSHFNSVHARSSQKIKCLLNGCQREFSRGFTLRSHIEIQHRKKPSSVFKQQNVLVEQLVQMKCQGISCGRQKVTSIHDLKSHLKSHFDKSEKVSCLFSSCEFETDNSGSMRSHFSRKHKNQSIDELKKQILTGFNEVSEANDNAVHIDEEVVSDLTEIHDEDIVEYDDEIEPEEEVDEIFLKSLAICFNTWMNVSGIPYSTVNGIVTEIFNSYGRGSDVTFSRVKKLLKTEGVGEDIIKKVAEALEETDPFAEARRELESEYKRKKYIKATFPNVEPVSVKLCPANEGNDSYQYIPIKESLKLLVEDESYIKQSENDPYFPEEDQIKDARDGRSMKENPFFIANPHAVPLLLFQDELEIANPLGSGKVKHKINCTYYTTLHVQSALRGKIKSIQLVSLVGSKMWKKYGNLQCNELLLTDLKDLELKGIEIEKPAPNVVKAGLFAFVGDNLGAHQIAELSCSFNSGSICRFCTATYKDSCQNFLLYSGCKEGYHPDSMTTELYDRLAGIAEEHGGATAETLGIKGHCIFNSLQSFHCIGSMAPCLGHDFFEVC